MQMRTKTAQLARRAAKKVPRQQRGVQDLAADLAAQGVSFQVQGVSMTPSAFFQWCSRDAWRLMTRGRVLIQPMRAGKKGQAWTLEVSSGQVSGRTTVTAGSASVWEPSEFSVSVYPDRAPMVAMAGSKDVWIVASLLALDASGLKFAREGGRISGNPSPASLALLRDWFAR